MPSEAGNRRWILAILTAALFPALVLHATCVAVMGPGTWGSGMQEVEPDFSEPTARAREYGRQIESNAVPAESSGSPDKIRQSPEIPGRIRWTHRSGDRAVFLAEERSADRVRQRLYVREDDRVRELALPIGHVVVRPQWAGERVLYERWNPWALPATGKLRRYFASWADTSLRPEAAIYESTTSEGGWLFRTPGHSHRVSPDGRYVAFLRSGALLAGYYSVHVGRLDDREAVPILSLREHELKGTKSFDLRWSQDSEALRIHGRTGGFSRRGSRAEPGSDGLPVDVIYLTADQSVYDLTSEH